MARLDSSGMTPSLKQSEPTKERNRESLSPHNLINFSPI